MADLQQNTTSPNSNTTPGNNPHATHSLEERQQQAIYDSDLDPAAFLKSVRELSEKRDREDAERYRKLEQDIEAQKLARARRREGMLGDGKSSGIGICV